MPTESEHLNASPVEITYRKTVKFLKGLGTFRRTRKAVLTRRPIWDLSADERHAESLMAPWVFWGALAIYLTMFSSTLSTILGFIDTFIIKNYLKDYSDQIRELYKALSFLNYASWATSIYTAVIYPSLVWWIIGFSSLKEEHSNAETRERARNAFLYISTSQLIGTAFICATLSILYKSPAVWMMLQKSSFSIFIGNNKFIIYAIAIGFSLMLVRALFVGLIRVPNLLFIANSYTTRFRIPFTTKRFDDPPRFKLYASYFGVYIISSSILYVTGSLGGRFLSSFG